MKCPTCGNDTTVVTNILGKPGQWGCRKCVKIHSTEQALIGQKYCDGNPGHGPISQLEARRQDSLMLDTKLWPGHNVPYEERHKVVVPMSGMKRGRMNG